MQKSTLLEIAGGLMIIAAMIMLYYGLGGFLVYINSITYYNTPIFEAALYLGIWNCCAFPFALVGGIFLLKKRHIRLSILGMVLSLVSGFVVFAVFNDNATYGLELGAPLIFLSILSLALLAISKR